MDYSKYIVKVKLFNSYFDCNDKIKPTAIFNLFQDVACVNGEQLGVGFEAMISKNLYWVLSRVKYDIIIAPKVDEEVFVETWPCEKGKIDFDRDFLIKNLNGEVLIMGTSKWCVISSVTRTLERTDNVNYNCTCLQTRNYTEKFVKTEAVEIKDKADFVHTVTFSEIDHNQHLNNVNYATYVTNTLTDYYFNHLQVNFISECKLGDEIKVFKKQTDNGYLISGYVNETLKFSAFAK